MQKANSKTLAFRLLAVTSTMSMTAAFLAAAAPPVRAAQVGGVQGTIKDTTGQAVPGAQVQLIPQGGAPRFARTDASGYYSFAGVDPGTYTIQVNVVTFNPIGQPVAISQDIDSTVDFTLVKRVLTRRGTGITIPLTRPNDTQTDQPVSAEDERREKSQPNNLYQSTGLLNYKTGVTVDAGQYPHVRGSDGNQINWSIDGIDLRDPITNQFATNLVTAGISSSNIITGGANASYGGSAGAYLNQISANGREISKGKPYAGFVEQTNGPGSKWGYSGASVQVGGVLLNNKLDYALSSIVFKTKYGDNTQLGELHSSHDEVGKFNYYAGPNDTFTTFFAHGAENYNSYQTTPNSLFFDPDKVRTDPATGRQYTSVRDLGTSFNDHSVQTYNLDHFTYKHNFAASSYLQYRVYQLHQAIPNHEEQTGNFYNTDRSNVTGNQINYYNQLNKNNILEAGVEYKDAKGSYRRQIVNVQRGDLATTTSALLRYSDRTYNAYPQDFALYLSDQLRAAQNRLTFNYGLRFQSTTYKGGDSKYADSIGDPLPSQYTTKSTDPRLGLTFTPVQDLTFRSSYTINSQHADERRIERLGPEDVGDVGTSINPGTATLPANLVQSRDAYRAQGFSRVSLSHSKDFDLGVEKGFNLRQGLLQGAYNFSVTGYQKYGYDIAFQTSPNYANANKIFYNNDGTQHASGFEFSFRKLQRRPSDWSGYLNYTNQVVRTNASLYDTAYTPYFALYEAQNFDNATVQGLVRKEFAPSWDQRHTVALVAHKNINKLFGATFILDAGSGLPFYTGSTSNGNFGAISNGFANIGAQTTGGAEFTQVPISLGGGKLPPLNPLVGYTGWHYKISVNTDFNLTDTFSLFLNVDNVFDKKTALSLATGSFSGEPYYTAPTAQYPQGQEVYRYQSKLTPVYLTFGFRQRF